MINRNLSLHFLNLCYQCLCTDTRPLNTYLYTAIGVVFPEQLKKRFRICQNRSHTLVIHSLVVILHQHDFIMIIQTNRPGIHYSYLEKFASYSKITSFHILKNIFHKQFLSYQICLDFDHAFLNDIAV